MKEIIIVFTLVLCLLLQGCSPGDASADSFPPDNSPGETETKRADEIGSSEQTDSSNVSVEKYTPPDYSGHDYPGEDHFHTMLADPSKLINGERIIVNRDDILDWDVIRDEFLDGLERKDEVWAYDVRHADLSKADLSSIEDFNDLSFNTRTI